MSTSRKRSKIAVFIRDVPSSFGHAPIAARLLASLASKDVYPVYSYSLLDLLKDKRNLKKIRLLSGSPGKLGPGIKGSDDAIVIARGCDILLRHLFERAIRSCPELIVVDYLSETFVDVRKMTKLTKKLNYKVIFLKADLCDEKAISDAASRITSRIKYQNHAEIWCQREADKWWHEIDQIYLNDQNKAESSTTEYSPHLHKLHSASDKDICASTSSTKCSECIAQEVERYYSKLEELASMLSGDLESYSAWEDDNSSPCPTTFSQEENFEDSRITGTDSTLLVIDDFHFRRPGRRRLFDLIAEKLIEEKISFHAIPIGQLVTMPKFQVLFDWYCARSDMGVMDTYSYLFLDTFYSLYRKENIVLLDNIHEGIVMSSYYISRAVEKNWEVLVLKRDKFWPPNDEEIVEKVISRMKEKYTMKKCETGNMSNISLRNYAFGDFSIWN
ncbi:unnamed protein product [Allacma fusca]|uniref:Uncharacterized protein n=1 Tax=Allacma fusca TaxID=39272 RepID=A0A8J2JWC1_9HEXA|nr:unnamed protein product [Allacma fusca]